MSRGRGKPRIGDEPGEMKPAKRRQAGFAVGYLAESERPWVSLIFLAPFVIAYQLYATGWLTPAQGISPSVGVQITAFLLVEQFFALFGASGACLPPVALIALLLLAHFLRRDPCRFHVKSLLLMGIESIGWALPLLAMGWLLARFLPLGTGLGRSASVLLALGAGIYEEMIFRLAGVTLLNLLIVRLFHARPKPAAVLIVLTSGIVFALYHYLSPAETFRARTFLFRATAGAYFGLLYLLRGFGVTAGSHAAYDLVVVSLLMA